MIKVCLLLGLGLSLWDLIGVIKKLNRISGSKLKTYRTWQ